MIESTAKKPFDAMRELSSDMWGSTGFRGFVTPMLGKMLPAVLKKLAPFDIFDDGDGDITWENASARLQEALRWARTQHGLPYQWGGGGNPSWDCSGFMAGIENVIRGVRPGRRYTTHSFSPGNPPSGWQHNLRSPFMVGVRHGGRGGGHMSGTLLGVPVESSSGGVQVGRGARGAGNSMYSQRYGFRPVVREATPAAPGGDVSALARGTDSIPKDDLYFLHRGEKVVPAADNIPQYTGGGGGIVLEKGAIDFSNSIVTSQRQVEDMVVRAIAEAERKGRIAKGTARSR
ncbi:hypothetical protein [Nocardiopsis nanhaiensis]